MSERRGSVPFDPEHFGRRAEAGERLDRTATFREILRTNHWAGASVSGEGSSDDQTRALRAALPPLLASLGVRTLLDVPCGDGDWIATMPLPGADYIGGDLLPELVERNKARHAAPGRRYLTIDLLTTPLPSADLLLCRDCLVHLSFADAALALGNIRRSPVTWLLTTTFPDERENRDITTGDWRPLNLERPPFGFPPPAGLLVEECTEGNGLFRDKSLGLWRVRDLPSGPPIG